jgi:predicted transcriptional regulator
MLTYARRRAGLSQRALAAKAGVAQPAIARIESGAISPRVETLDRLLRLTGVALEAIPVAGTGVDRTLIRSALAKSPEQRVTDAASAARNLSSFMEEVERGAVG